MKKILFPLLLTISQILWAQSDCGSALPACGNSQISYTPTGPGQILEDLGGCLSSDEHYSVWYTFTAATAGTLTFEIVPNGNADYDWAVYGPNKPCGNLGAPIRCSYDAPPSNNGLYNTGLSLTAANLTDPAGGTGYCRYLDVLPGQTYYLVVDNFSQNANGFVLTWGGTAILSNPFNQQLQPNPFIAPGPNQDGEVVICTNPAQFDFSTLTDGIINGNPNFHVSYHLSNNDALTGNNPIIGMVNVNTAATYIYAIYFTDPNNPNNGVLSKCKQFGTITFDQRAITTMDAVLTECSSNDVGVASYDLTTANVNNDPAVVKKYYASMAELNAGIEIANPFLYTSAEGEVFVKATSPFGCTSIAKITLKFHPLAIKNDQTMKMCHLENLPSNGIFNLTQANVTGTAGIVKKYYPSPTDAVNETNEILNPTAYNAPNGVVFVKLITNQGCYNIAKITLEVTPPDPSPILKDQVICTEKTTTLDAGPGYLEYLWSTGETTPSISNVGVGDYWVKLTKDGCETLQKVKILPVDVPSITNVEIGNGTLAVTVYGGKAPYKYSLDNITWQDSNVFTAVPRGVTKIYVKDESNCEPIITEVTVPNIINLITPNDDGVNDVVDYSALSMKDDLTFTVFDRYGSVLHQANKNNNYQWDGKLGGRKLSTGTYWYVITWKEKDANKTPIKFSGWIMVKNRD
ncbi:T9SS type B sorting domain-containing protein [Amniculibacterium sp. G2-70]|uniref:T9SS type B sorting domain-containing protein n=1 Tax=Amniculibacterium sp. G2-70 TaxID=2767188 RepID=UPI00165420F3|nr:T9SS type B sorting domain-containing protein [Amniculibacterium sp. G2-70]